MKKRNASRFLWSLTIKEQAMKKSKNIFLVFCLFFYVSAPYAVKAATDVSNQDESVRKLGMNFNMAEDRRMENIGGIYQPEDLDKYMKRHFDALDNKINQLLAQNQRIEQKLDQLLATKGNSGGGNSGSGGVVR